MIDPSPWRVRGLSYVVEMHNWKSNESLFMETSFDGLSLWIQHSLRKYCASLQVCMTAFALVEGKHYQALKCKSTDEDSFEVKDTVLCG